MSDETEYLICDVCGREVEADEAYAYTNEVPICSDTCWEKWQTENEG
jgi:hypothetical protein